ncbi:hypothetical protein [Rhizobium sp. PAMB 3182]
MTLTADPSDIRLTDRPLIVSDIDDVVLQFIDPFNLYLESLGHRHLPRSFRLHGNIVSIDDGSVVDDSRVTALIRDFYRLQSDWQRPFDTACETLYSLSKTADIVFLTAMPPVYAETRRALLDRFGLRFPMIATEAAKGPVVERLHAGRDQPVVFLDDMARNLASVAEHVPECLLIHLKPPAAVFAFAPPAGDGVVPAQDWSAAETIIRSHFQSMQGRAAPKTG